MPMPIVSFTARVSSSLLAWKVSVVGHMKKKISFAQDLPLEVSVIFDTLGSLGKLHIYMLSFFPFFFSFSFFLVLLFPLENLLFLVHHTTPESRASYALMMLFMYLPEHLSSFVKR